MFKRIQKLYLIIHRPCKKRYAFTEQGIAYDANGNTTHDGRTGQDLAWNELNLIAVVSQGSGAAASTLASYTGGRITAQKNASTGAITGYTVHHHITDHLVDY